MQITFELDDRQVLDMSKMVNVSFLVDKAYKAIKPEIVNHLTHMRKTISSFNMWFEKLNPAEQDHVRHSINSTIDVNEIVPEGTNNRDLIIESITRYRENKKIYDRTQNAQTPSAEISIEGSDKQ
jgi:hypothetical protein